MTTQVPPKTTRLPMPTKPFLQIPKRRGETRDVTFTTPTVADARTNTASLDTAARLVLEQVQSTSDSHSSPSVRSAKEVESALAGVEVTPEGRTETTGREHLCTADSNADLYLPAVTVEDPRRLEGSNTPSRRLDTFKEFTRQHANIVRTRIQADEFRRRARSKRSTLLGLVRNLTYTIQRGPQAQSNVHTPTADPWPDVLSDLETLEEQLDQVEEELVQAESTVKRLLPQFEGSEAGRTFDILEQHQIYFPVESSESSVSERGNPDLGAEPHPEHAKLLEKLDDVNEIEEALVELRDDEQRLRDRDITALEAEDLLFLSTYEGKKARLKDKLHNARAELEDLRYSRFLLEEEAPIEHLLMAQLQRLSRHCRKKTRSKNGCSTHNYVSLD